MSRLGVHPRDIDAGDDGHAAVKFSARFQSAMALLFEAYRYAEQTNRDRWEFAVEIRELLKLGLMKNDLRWLMRMRYVDHAREVTAQGENGRAFRPTGDLTFTKRSCFVLTSLGVIAMRGDCEFGSDNGAASAPTTVSPQAKEAIALPRVPEWDAEMRELRLGEEIVKRFKWHAINQEAVLAAFQEEGWPQRIDDPLSPKAEQDAKRRLSDTIKCLNRKQQNQLLHFRGDGTGEGVIWESLEQNSPTDDNSE